MMITALVLCLLAIPATNGAEARTWLERFHSGWDAFERGEFESARAEWTSSLDLAPHNATVAYHLACVESRSGHVDAAIEWLEKAQAWGYADAEVARRDADLASLRKEARFASCLERMTQARSDSSVGGVASDTCRLEAYFAGGTGSVSPDGTRLLLDSSPAALIEIETGAVLATLPAPHEGWNIHSAFSPDGRLVATASTPGSVRVWNAWSGELVRELSAPSVAASALEFSADGTRVLSTGGVEDSALVWDLASGRLIFVATKPARALACVRRDGRRAMTAGVGGLDLWDTETKHVIASKQARASRFGGGFTSDGTLAFAWSSEAGFVWAFDAETGRGIEQRKLEHPGDALAVRGASHQVAIVEADNSITLLDPLERTETRLTAPSSTGVFEIQFSPDGTLLAEVTAEDLRVISCESGAMLWHLSSSGSGSTRRPHFGPDSATLLVEDWGAGLVAYDAHTGRVRIACAGYARSPDILAQAQSGNRVCIAAGPGQLHLVDPSRAESPLELEVAPGTCVDFSPDGEQIALVDPRGTLEIRECVRGERVSSWATGIPPSTEYSTWRQPRWSPAGDRMLVHSYDQPALLLDLHGGARIAELGAGGFNARVAAWSLDGRFLAASIARESVAVFDAHDGIQLAAPLVHAKPLNCVSFDPRGERLLTGAQDACGHVWDWKSGRELLRLSHADQDWDDTLEVGDAQFSPDGTQIATSTCSFWEIALWNASTGARRWAYDYSGGNPASVALRFDCDGKGVYESGLTRGRVATDVASGRCRVDGKSIAPRGVCSCVPSPSRPLYFVGTNGGISVYGTRDDRLRCQRIDRPGRSLVASASRHFAGDAAAAETTRLTFGERSESLADYASLLFDPKRVRAACDGVALQPVRLPPLPRVLAPAEDGAVLPCSDSALEFELGCDSEAQPSCFRVWISGLVCSCRPEDGKRSVSIRVERPAQGNRVPVRARVIDSIGLESRAVRFTVLFGDRK